MKDLQDTTKKLPKYIKWGYRKGVAILPPRTDAENPLQLFNLFCLPEMFEQWAEWTNLYTEKAEEISAESTTYNLPWVPVTAADLRVFIGVLLSLGLDSKCAINACWELNIDTPILPWTNYCSRDRFKQILRYFKASLPLKDNKQKHNYWDKVEPWTTQFREAARSLYISGTFINVNKQLILYKCRATHTTIIDSKAAGRGIKIHSIGEGIYIIDFLFDIKG